MALLTGSTANRYRYRSREPNSCLWSGSSTSYFLPHSSPDPSYLFVYGHVTCGIHRMNLSAATPAHWPVSVFVREPDLAFSFRCNSQSLCHEVGSLQLDERFCENFLSQTKARNQITSLLQSFCSCLRQLEISGSASKR